MPDDTSGRRRDLRRWGPLHPAQDGCVAGVTWPSPSRKGAPAPGRGRRPLHWHRELSVRAVRAALLGPETACDDESRHPRRRLPRRVCAWAEARTRSAAPGTPSVTTGILARWISATTSAPTHCWTARTATPAPPMSVSRGVRTPSALSVGSTLTEGFEAPSGWTFDSDNTEVQWQLDSSKAHSGTKSLYCGNPETYSYDHGKTKAAATRTLGVPWNATLSLWFWAEIAEPGCNFDVLRVRINDVLLEPEVCGVDLRMGREDLVRGHWSGQTVLLTLEFDTVDNIDNAGEGVWIDDLSLSTEDLAPNSPCCEGQDDCEGEGAWCHPASLACMPTCEGEVCDDGLLCTHDLGCAGTTECQYIVAPSTCDDDNPCTSDTCDPSTAAYTPTPPRATCAASAPCFEASTCQSGQCVAGEAVICDDNDACNGLETCESSTGCVDGESIECDDDNPCTTDTCHPIDGCVHTNTAEGDMCGESTPCFEASTCQSGQCVAGEAVVCDDNDACNGLRDLRVEHGLRRWREHRVRRRQPLHDRHLPSHRRLRTHGHRRGRHVRREHPML